MLTFCYKKAGAAAFIPHVDALRQIIRTIRRADIKVNYSQGFNPHMNLYLSPPSPLGYDSLCEYCTVDTSLRAEEFMERYNRYCVKGMECVEATDVSKNPNIAGVAAAALYEIESRTLKENFEQINGRTLSIIIEKDGNTKVREITQDILDLQRTENGIAALLKFGNLGNLRIDYFLDAIRKEFDFELTTVIKKELYCKDGKGNLLSARDYISGFSI